MADTASIANSASRKFDRINRHDASWAGICAAAAAVISFADARSALTIVLAVALTVVSLSRPVAGLSVLVATVPLQEGWPARLGSVELTWTRVALLSLVVAWSIRFLLGRERLRLNGVAWALLAFCGALVLSIVNAQNVDSWAEENYRWSVAALILVIALSVVRSEIDRISVLAGLAVGIGFSFGVAVYQVATSTGPETFNQRGFLRAYGMFGEPNPFAGYLEIATLPLIAAGIAAFARPVTGRSKLLGALAIGAAGLGCITIAMTQSRGGLLGFGAGLAAICWFTWPRAGRRLVAVAAGICLVAIWTPQAGSVRSTFGFDGLLADEPNQVTSANWAAQERLAHWGAAAKMWQEHPWLGIGAGNFPDRFREFTPTWRFRISRGHAHSAYLQAASQAGVVGLACFVAVLCAAWRSGLQWLRDRASRFVSGRHTAAVAVTAAIAVHGLFDYLHVLSLGIVLSTVWAMGTTEEVANLSEPVRHGRG